MGFSTSRRKNIKGVNRKKCRKRNLTIEKRKQQLYKTFGQKYGRSEDERDMEEPRPERTTVSKKKKVGQEG